MSFVKKIWFDPVKLDASNINRIEQGLKNSYDNIEIIKEEVLSLQLSNAKLTTRINTLFSNSPKMLEDISSIQTILNSNSAIIETLKGTNNLLTKEKQLLTSEEIKQVQSNLGINKFLHLTDIKLNGESIVSGSEVEINLPTPDTKLDPSSDNSLSNKAIAQALQELSKSIKYSDIIGTPTYKDIVNNHSHNNLYALIDHIHINYALTNHNHDTRYARVSHDHNNIYSLYNHTHKNYSDINHTHSNINTEISNIKITLEEAVNSLKNNSNYATEDYVKQNGGKIDTVYVNSKQVPIINKSINIEIPTSLDQLTNIPNYISAKDAKDYTDYTVATLIDNAPETLNTLNELAVAIKNNDTLIKALNEAIGNKANKTHTHEEKDITNLKAYALSSHKHTEADITDLKSYALRLHSHTVTDITDLSTELSSTLASAKTYTNTQLEELNATFNEELETLTNDIESNTNNITQLTGELNEGITELNDKIIELNTSVESNTNIINSHTHDALYSKLAHKHTEADITDLRDYVTISDNQTITGTKYLSYNTYMDCNGGKIYRRPLTTPEVYSTEKRHLLTTNGLNNPITTINEGIYMSDGKLYSENTEVSLKGHTHTLSNITDAIKLTDLLVPYGTNIPANADLNSVEYLKVGHYYHPSDHTTPTLKNCPTTSAFNMKVYSPLSTTIDNEETGVWMYRLRELTTYTGTTYRQLVNTNETPGVFIFNNWIQISDSTHTHDYLPLSGGKMTGRISFKDNNALPEASTMDFILGIDSYATGGGIKYINKEQAWVGEAGCAGYLKGFKFAPTSQTWGNQIGTFICGMDDETSGSLAFRRDNPTPGQLSMIIDGTVYVKEGQKEVATKEDIPTDYVTYQEDSTTAWAEANLTTILNKVYPIGAVYLSVNTTSPATLFGGTWVELSSGNALWVTSVSAGNAGQTISAGLPNITGSITVDAQYNLCAADGAFSMSTQSGDRNNGSTAQTKPKYSFDASRSNAIYGNSTTVQPPAIRVYAWKRTA